MPALPPRALPRASRGRRRRFTWRRRTGARRSGGRLGGRRAGGRLSNHRRGDRQPPRHARRRSLARAGPAATATAQAAPRRRCRRAAPGRVDPTAALPGPDPVGHGRPTHDRSTNARLVRRSERAQGTVARARRFPRRPLPLRQVRLCRARAGLPGSAPGGRASAPLKLRASGRGRGYSVRRALLESFLEAAYVGDWPARLWSVVPGVAEVSVTRHSLTLPSGAGQRCRLAFVSDIHVGPTTPASLLENAFAAIRQALPDVLLLG